MSSIRELPHSYIKIGKRYRKDLGDLSSLTESIRTVGLIQRIVVDKNHNLIVGHRRFEAYRLAKPDSPIPVIVVDDLDDAATRLIAERDENTCRKEMASSELYELGKAIERLERPKAEVRQRASLKHSSLGPEEPNDAGSTREKVAEGLGVSPSKWQRLKAVGDAASSGDEQAVDLIKKVDSGDITLTSAQKELTEKRRKALPGAVADLRSLPKRKSATFMLQRISEQLNGYADEIDKIDVTQIDAAEAQSLAGSLGRTRSVLSKTINSLRSIA